MGCTPSQSPRSLLRGEKDSHQGTGGETIFHVGEEIPLNKINAAGLLEEEVALLRSNGSLKRRSVRSPMWSKHFR